MKLFILLLAISIYQINSQGGTTPTPTTDETTSPPVVVVSQEPVIVEEEIIVPLEEGESEMEIEAIEQGEWYDFDFDGLKAFVIAQFLRDYVQRDLPQSNFRRNRDYAVYVDAERLNYKVKSELIDANIGVVDATIYVYYDPVTEARDLISAEYALLEPVDMAEASTNPLLTTLSTFGAGQLWQRISGEQGLDTNYQVEKLNNVYRDVLETPEGEVDLYRFDADLLNPTQNRRFHVIYYVAHNALSNVNTLGDSWYEELGGAAAELGEALLAAEEGVIVLPTEEVVIPTEGAVVTPTEVLVTPTEEAVVTTTEEVVVTNGGA